MSENGMQRILITGAAGKIGQALRAGLRGLYPVIRLSDIAPLGQAAPGEEVCPVDIRDLAAAETSMIDIDCVVHLAGVSEEDVWDKVLPMNIEGCYNVFEAARRQGVKRVIFASSNHAVGFHRRELGLSGQVRPFVRIGFFVVKLLVTIVITCVAILRRAYRVVVEAKC